MGAEGVNSRMDHSVRFGQYRFDPGTARLWSGQSEIRLTPKAAAVLRLLLTNAGTPVRKEDFFASVWSDTIVGDDALTSCIQELRRALGDDAKTPRFIETRHRRGYQFVAPLCEPTAETPDPLSPPPDTVTIAVLPFADLSRDRDQDYFCEGLAEELINALTHVAGVRVVARAASFQLRGTGADLQLVAQQLGVGALLAGSVQKADQRLRVTVQLIEVATGYQRWSDRFDRTPDDIFAIQDEIAECVAASLRGSMLGPGEKQALVRPHTTAEAYDYYLRGRQYLPRMTRTDLERSRTMFERAIRVDADYAPALAGLATAHALLYEWFGARESDQEGAERASKRALDLAPGLAEAHVARGLAVALSRSYTEAAREFEDAIRLHPNLFDAYYYYGRTAFACGDVERSAELFRRASEVGREDFQSPSLLGQSLRMLGQSEAGRRATREAIARAERILALNPVDGRALSLCAGDLFEDGQRDRALAFSRRALELYPDDTNALVLGACLHARLGHKNEALDLLQRSFSRGWGKRAWVEHDPDFDSLRDDPRFRELLARLR